MHTGIAAGGNDNCNKDGIAAVAVEPSDPILRRRGVQASSMLSSLRFRGSGSVGIDVPPHKPGCCPWRAKPGLRRGCGLLEALVSRWPDEAARCIHAFTSPLAEGAHFLPPRAEHLVTRADVVGHVLARRPPGREELLEDGAP